MRDISENVTPQVAGEGGVVHLLNISGTDTGTIVCPYGSPEISDSARRALQESGVDLNVESKQWIVGDGESPSIFSLDRTKYDLCSKGSGFRYSKATKILLKKSEQGSGWILDRVINPAAAP